MIATLVQWSNHKLFFDNIDVLCNMLEIHKNPRTQLCFHRRRHQAHSNPLSKGSRQQGTGDRPQARNGLQIVKLWRVAVRLLLAGHMAAWSFPSQAPPKRPSSKYLDYKVPGWRIWKVGC